MAPNRFRATHKVLQVTELSNRHEIRDLRYPRFGQKTRQQDIGIRQIKLALHRVVNDRTKLKSSAFLVIQQGRENGG